MADEKQLWVLQAGNKTVKSGKNLKPAFLITTMDEMAATEGGPIVIETDDEKVLNKAAEYAAQKGYALVSPDPEKNLKIMEKQNALVGEEIADGELGPSQQKLLETPTVKLPKEKEPEQGPLEKLEAMVNDPLQGVDPVADIAKIAEQTKQQKNPFDEEVANQNRKKALTPTVPDFPEKRPAEVLARRFLVPTAKDHGNRLVITRMGMMAVTPPQRRKREELITATLLKARERFGDPVRVTGNKAFEHEVIKAAIAQGIPLEMGSDRGEKAYALALQNEQKLLAKTVGRLEPAKERTVEKSAPAKGVGRGLAL